MTQNPTHSSETQENTILPTEHYCRKNDAEIQRRIDRGIWRPSLDTGHVYSTVKKANLKESPKRNGYLTVTDHKQIFRVHRIIWIAAHGIPDAEYQIDHINGNKEDKRLQNLQLITGHDNTARSSLALTFADAEEIRKLHKEGYSRRTLAEQYGVSETTIRRIVTYQRYKTNPPREQNLERAKEEASQINPDIQSRIRKEASNGTSLLQIARRYNITMTTVRCIIRGDV